MDVTNCPRVQWAKDVGKTVAEAVAKCVEPIMEPKYNGWRIVVIRTADGVDLYKPMRNSDPAKRYNGKLPELEADLMKLPVGTILDGELVAMTYDVDSDRWVEDFFRVHTVMRSNETLACQREGIKLVAFDCPMPNKASRPLAVRREYVQALIEAHELRMVELTIQMPASQANYEALVASGMEGAMVKDASKPYAFGKRGHGFFKVKNNVTIDCVVMEVVMDGKGQHEGKAGRMRVGQIKGGELVEVCSINCLNDKQRAEATANPQLFLGRVIEVKIYGWTVDGPRHPTPLHFREDKLAAECEWSRS